MEIGYEATQSPALFLAGYLYRKAFAKMDLDGNGMIDAEELGIILKSFGEAVPPGRLKAFMREVQNKKSRFIHLRHRCMFLFDA